MKKNVLEYPKNNFGVHENSCNLSCPNVLCIVKTTQEREPRKTLDRMNITEIVNVFDEVRRAKPIVSPSFWLEPLLNKRLFKISTSGIFR